MRKQVTVMLRFLALALLLAGTHAARAADDFLDPRAAFKFAARALDERTVEVSFTIAPGYYLYREQFKFEASGATLGVPAIPAGKVKYDETFQKNVETHRDVLRIAVPVVQASEAFLLTVTSQGCADKGLCYPPMQSAAKVGLVGFGGDGKVNVVAASPATALESGLTADSPRSAAINTASASDSSRIDAALRDGRFWTVVAVFFVAGVLLSLTPCVLPMLPILSSIIVGQGAGASRGRGLGLAASYSLGMALVYTAFGVAAGLAGEGLAAALQNPWVLGAFALGLVGLALSMFGAYEIQLPAALTGGLSSASQRLPAGRVAGVFAMGGLSALIVSPCVAAPLAGALVYLSQTRDVWLGGSALFSLASGMSVPLLLVGASAGALLPKAGAWMDEIKQFFGVLLIGVALWIVQPVMPSALALALWGALAICSALLMVMRARHHRPRTVNALWRRAVAALLGVFGAMQLVGAVSGGADPLQPLAHLARGAAQGSAQEHVKFTLIHSVAELDAALLASKQAGRPAILDFYADWCVSCKEMDRFTFSDPAIAQRMNAALLLKADVTANNAQDRELLKRFRLFGPPGTIFFSAQGSESPGTRVIGFQDREQFGRSLHAAGL